MFYIGQLHITRSYYSSYQLIASPYISRDVKVYNLTHCYHDSIVEFGLTDKNEWEHQDKTTRLNYSDTAKYIKDKKISMLDTGEFQPTGYVNRVIYTPSVTLHGRLYIASHIPANEPSVMHLWRVPEQTFTDTFKSRSILIQPNDERYPRIEILTSTIRTEFFEMLKTNFVEIYALPGWRYHCKYPLGHIMKILDPFDSLQTAYKNILRLNDLSEQILPNALVGDFSLDLSNLPTTKGQIPGAKAYVQPDGIIREDVRDLDKMFTIDPETAKDLDDALSVRHISGTLYLIGVHIADVSHFIPENSPLDLAAMQRQTSIYLVGKCIPMLPKLLSEELCSLTPGEDKFTYSCYWLVDLARSRVEKRLVTVSPVFFAKTLNRSICRLSYKQAFAIYEKRDLPEDWTGLIKTEDPTYIRNSLNVLFELHRYIRASRPNWMELSREGGELSFTLNATDQIENIFPYEITEAHKMIETWMVETNRMAGKLQSPIISVLRNHKGFNPKRAAALNQQLQKLGISLDFSSKARFIESVKTIPEIYRERVIMAATYAIESAKYIIGPSEEDDTSTAHFGLDIEIYTHFTSPIRRYADILVHRNLSRLNALESPYELRSDYENILILANTQHNKSKRAERQSKLFNLNMYLKKLPSPLKNRGVVVNIREVGANLYVQLALDNVPIVSDDILLSLNDGKMMQPRIEKVFIEGDIPIILWKTGEQTPLKILSEFYVDLIYSDSTPPTSKIIFFSSV